MDEDSLEMVCSVIESAGKEAQQSHTELGYTLSNDTVAQLHQVFGAADVDPLLWDEVASRRVPLGLLGQAIAGVMDSHSGQSAAYVAADVFLGILLAPGCPIYSFFTPLAFLSFTRCFRNLCRRNSDTKIIDGNGKGQGKRGRKRGGKQKSEKSFDDEVDCGGVDVDGEMGDVHGSGTRAVGVEELSQLLGRVEQVLDVLQLKGYAECLKSLIELLVDIPHLMCDLGGDEGAEVLPRGPRAKRGGSTSSARVSPKQLCFRIMVRILQPNHGDSMATGVSLLRALSPSILMTSGVGSNQQRAVIRAGAIEFVTKEMIGIKSQSVRRSVVMLPRYLSVKAPEKTDARALAVEAIVMVMKVLNGKDQKEFGEFVAKLSRGKPRYRLVAVDLAVALLAALPDPLGINRVEEEEVGKENECVDNGDCFALEEDVSPVHNKEMEGDECCNLENEGSGIDKSNAKRSEITEERTGCNIWWGVKCLEAMLHRCSDKVPAIRARALTNMAQAVEILSADMKHRVQLQGLLGFRCAGDSVVHGFNAQPSNVDACVTPGQEFPSFGGQTPSPESNAEIIGATPVTPGVAHRDLGVLLRRRCMDDKVAVRKAALLLMTKSTALLGKPPDDIMLQAMGAACSDSMVSIRKAALSALSEVLRKFPVDRVISEWLQSVPSLVMDNESTIQEECLNQFKELVLERISSVASQNASNKRSKLSDASSFHVPEQEMEILFPQGVSHLLKGITDGNVASCVKRICMYLGKKGRLSAGIALALQNIITTSEALSQKYSIPIEKWTAPPGTWLLLSEVSLYVPKALIWDFLRHHWQILDKPEQNNEVSQGTPYNTPVKQAMECNIDEGEAMSIGWATDRVFLLQTISNVAVVLNPDAAAELAHNLLVRLEAFNMHPTEVGAHVKALITLCKRKAASEEEGTEIISSWADQLLAKAEGILEEYISQFSNADKSNSFKTPEPSRRTQSRTKKKGKTISSDFSSLSIQVVTAIFTVGALVLVCPTAKLGRLVTLLQAVVTSKGSSAGGNRVQVTSLLLRQVAPAVYTQSWVTLGKICLADHKLAKSCIPLFLQELEMTDSPAVRNNIMVAMTDFCVRYTALVDGCIPKLTKSLRDPCELVRRQTFILLARLLQRDYVKWKGILFHRFLLALVDESEKICQLADYLFGSILKTKAPLLAYNSFVEAIFILNDCHAHAGHSETLQTSESERHLFSLRGNNEVISSKRMHIYVSLLKQMAPEHLLATSAKLCAEILAAAADGLLNLDDAAAQCVLKDALQILACKEMRIQANRFGGAAENAELEEESGAAALAAAKGRVVTQIAKKNLIQNAIPIFIELKRLLESKNSPLIGCLMDCLRMILKEYKNEIDEILVADKQLQKELLYDIQKYESLKTKSQVAAAVATVQDSVPRHARSTPSNNAGGTLPTSAQRYSSAGSKLPPKTPASVAAVQDSVPHHTRSTPNTNAGGTLPTSAQRCSSAGSKLPPKTPASVAVCNGKENANAQTARCLGKASSMKRKTLISPGMDKSASGRVKWVDQDTRPSLTTPEAVLKTPMLASGKCQSGATSNAMKSKNGNPHPSNTIPASRRHKIASAVADVAAAQTVNAVMREVASGCSTPLPTMSIPRLKPSVPSILKARVGSAENSTGIASLLESEGQEGLRVNTKATDI